ncbi:MAG: ATP-binding cassette domain-containing protein [SAR324 cluster bacterium]|nr:ATP-binding cassette domain-containing protein [SAR324 cluster bacterium]
MAEPEKVLMSVRNLKKHYSIGSSFFKSNNEYIKAVDGIDLDLYSGKTLGLVGESGCGKSTFGKCIIRAIEPSAGEIKVYLDKEYSIREMRKSEFRIFRKNLQMIFQDPNSSLDPRMTIRDIISEPIKANSNISKKQLEEKVKYLMDIVGLNPNQLYRYPHAFSGGQRQRIGIARALANDAKIIICDEAVSALDVSVQAQIINLLKDLQEKFNLTLLFISHDLSVVEHLSDSVAVMYLGKIVEAGTSKNVFNNPQHPYTEALLSAVPKGFLAKNTEKIILKGEIESTGNIPNGCTFHPRCIYAKDVCRSQIPPENKVSVNQLVSCHFNNELQLRGFEYYTSA